MKKRMKRISPSLVVAERRELQVGVSDSYLGEEGERRDGNGLWSSITEIMNKNRKGWNEGIYKRTSTFTQSECLRERERERERAW